MKTNNSFISKYNKNFDYFYDLNNECLYTHINQYKFSVFIYNNYHLEINSKGVLISYKICKKKHYSKENIKLHVFD